MQKQKELILNLAAPLARAAGLEIWGLDIVSGPQTQVRLFVEAPPASRDEQYHADGPPPSATIDQCESISRQLGLALEVEDIFPNSWVLEVSSPGLERKFFNLTQLPPYIGDILEARLETPLDDPRFAGRKAFRGRLLKVGSDSFDLELCSIGENGQVAVESCPPCRIPWDRTRRLSRVHLFTPPPKPGKGTRKPGTDRKRK